MNNSVKDYQGKIIGFRCIRCGNVKSSMWGETCNECRSILDENRKLREEISRLTATINNIHKP